jgi:hypothetical protein
MAIAVTNRCAAPDFRRPSVTGSPCMPNEPIRIFVNAAPVDAEPGDSIIEAIARWNAATADALRSGQRALADSRGIVAPLDMPVHGGAIFRIVSARQLQANDDPFADA